MHSYQKFFHEFMLLYRPFISELNKQLEEYELFSSQWSIMFFIKNYGSLTPVEISKLFHVEKPTITRTVKALEQRNYIEHIPGKDKREKRLVLTPLGEEVYSAIRVKLDAFDAALLQGVSDNEQQDVIRIMGEIRNNLIK
ncbi:MarR family winged helix-turn-helix transcriptional regulator [Bacillus massiliigorillae]|uniref:MarR family winged helix-turn-helix transcriptional regulator n=1 Tax=Bacillus massiliigorillae TaxID=1243664 RepID=UPI0003A10A59|nr:MarR family transcriptional regulator [Bacillus massiliigorillae]